MRKVDLPCHMLLSEGDSILCNDRFPGRGVCGYENGVSHLQVVYSFFLERV
jgi:hypothetical protein